MSFPEFEERPAKKRRFFSDNTLENTSTSTSKIDDTENLKCRPQPESVLSGTSNTTYATSGVLDFSLVESVVGEKLDKDVRLRISSLAGEDVERGTSLSRATHLPCTDCLP